MLIYYINLDRRQDRNLRIERELNARELRHVRISACDGQSETALDTRFLTTGEVACWQSHQNVYATICAATEDFALVLEDDAELPEAGFSRELLEKISSDMKAEHIDILQLGFLETLYSFRNIAATVKSLEDLKNRRMRRLSALNRNIVVGDFRSGTHAYVVSRRAAAALLDTNMPTARAADDFLGDLASGFRSGRHEIKIARLNRSLVGQVGRTSATGTLDSDTAHA
jgi:GR25 family glycosyltransferase involved in LPS biosynthesis